MTLTALQNFQQRNTDMASPADDIVPIDLSSTDATPSAPYRSIFLPANGTAGNVTIDTLTGTSRVVYMDLGTLLPVMVTKIYKTGTAAVGLQGLV